MTTALPFSELLQRDGAIPPRWGRGKWRCGHCPERSAPALSVDLERELFNCWRCGRKGGRRTLERERGIETAKPTTAEVWKRRVVRREAGRFAEWARRKRIGLAALLRDLDRHEAVCREVGREQLAAGEPVGETVWGKLHLAGLWGEQAETQWRRLCEFEANAGEFYQEYLGQKAA